MSEQNERNSRRSFLKKSIAGVAGVSLFPTLIKAEKKLILKTKKEKKRKIITRTLGKTDIKVPVIGMGCYTTLNENVVRAALDAGIACFDTAPNYGRGNSETMLGNMFQGRPRNSFVIATKHFGFRDNRTGLIPENVTPAEYRESFRKSIDESLKRMKLYYVDIFHILVSHYNGYQTEISQNML